MIAKLSIIGMRPIIFLLYWSQSDPSVHYALVEFPDMAELRKATGSDGFKFVIADYDRVWGSKGVTRARDIIEKVQHRHR